MGCLSANRRNLFSKEPVKQYAKRYVWVLNEDKYWNFTEISHLYRNSTATHNKKRKSIENEFPPTTESLPSINTSPEPEFEQIENYEDFFGKWNFLEISHLFFLDMDQVVEEPTEEIQVEIEEEKQPTEEAENEENEEEEEENSKKKSSNKKMNDRCDNAVDLITEALKEMGGKATGVQITDWLAVNYKQLGTDKKKLGYTVNAVLSSKKYKGKFVKDKMVQGGSRALWKLASSPKDKQRKN